LFHLETGNDFRERGNEMIAYKRRVVVQDAGLVVLSGLPFQPGQPIEVVMIAETLTERSDRVERWRELFAKTQCLPQSKTITEEEITAEIEAYRAGQ
jgi:hypothetical protein